MKTETPSNRYRFSLRSLLLAMLLLGFALRIGAPLWRYVSTPRPLLGRTVKTRLAVNVAIEVEVYACAIEDLQRYGLLPKDARNSATYVAPPLDERLRNIRRASNSRRWKPIAFPSIKVASGCPVTYSRKLDGLLRLKNAEYRIDLIPISRVGEGIRLEIRNELIDNSASNNRPEWSFTAVEMNENETIVTGSVFNCEGPENNKIGIVVIATPTRFVRPK